jgi:hypothetical protein
VPGRYGNEEGTFCPLTRIGEMLEGIRTVIKAWRKHVALKHKWKPGRNIYHRVCEKCGRNEEVIRIPGRRDFWEQSGPTAHSPDLCEDETQNDSVSEEW